MTQQQAAADLAYIRSILAESRAFAESCGPYFVIWGALTSLGMFGTWAIATRLIAVPGAWIWGLWVAVVIAGIGLSSLLEKRSAAAPVQHVVNRQIGHVWFAIGMANMLLFFAGQYFGIISATAIPSIAAVLLGVGVYLTGVFAKLNWMRNLCVAWWLAALLLMIWPGRTAFLIYAILCVAFFVAPGIKLQRLAQAARG
jgi:hypothetical protein